MKNEITELIKQYNEAHAEFTCKKSVSVSKCINCIKEEFDTEGVAQKMFEKYYHVEGSKYYQMTKEAIIALWDDKREKALKKGRTYDAMMEQLIEIRNPEVLQLWKDTVHYKDNAFLQLAYKGFTNLLTTLNQFGYTCIGTEIQLFCRNSKKPEQIINGRCDCLMYSSKLGRYLIIDWKTNEEIKTTCFKQLLGPSLIYPAADYYTYMIQLSFYKKALVETYNLAADEQVDILICQMGTSNNGYISYNSKVGNYIYNSAFLDSLIEYAYIKLDVKTEIAKDDKNSNPLF